jgi:Cys-tRNA(Pro)/Cys-tRNA(Cys) deacylase
LDEAGIAYELRSYAYDPGAERIGVHAAASLGVPAAQVLKTLIAYADGKPVCVVVPSDREIGMKRLAQALGAKAAEMSKPADAERLTGYRVGGISPFGQRRRLPTVIDAAALAHDAVFVNGGQRGLQLRLRPADLVAATSAIVAALAG